VPLPNAHFPREALQKSTQKHTLKSTSSLKRWAELGGRFFDASLPSTTDISINYAVFTSSPPPSNEDIRALRATSSS
jgi:hypothetical protein